MEKEEQRTTIWVSPETRNDLHILKHKHNFSSMNSLIKVLISNSELLRKIIKQHRELDNHSKQTKGEE